MRQVELTCTSCCGRVDIPCPVEGLGRVVGLAGSSDPARRVSVRGAMQALPFLKRILVPLAARGSSPYSSPRSCEGPPSSDEWAFAVFPLEQGGFGERRVRQHPLCAGFLGNRITASRLWQEPRSPPNLEAIPRVFRRRHMVPGSRRGLIGHACDGTGQWAGARRRAPLAHARGFIATSVGRLHFPEQLLRVYVHTYCGVVEQACADDHTPPHLNRGL